MTDLEIKKLCAEAIRNCDYWESGDRDMSLRDLKGNIYDPLHDDAQAMALVKKHTSLGIMYDKEWFVTDGTNQASSKELNRAICECVAKIQAAK